MNVGIDKNSYLNSDFALQFPTVDRIISELKKVSMGAHLFKIYISRVFRHIKVDPVDSDRLGLHWGTHYVDMCLPFGSHHGMQIFQRISDTIRFIIHQRGHRVMNYIDDFFGVGMPCDARHALYSVLEMLGLSMSEEKSQEIDYSRHKSCLFRRHFWKSRSYCSRRQLQSLLGHLLYVQKCVKPAHYFVNRMLDLLRTNYDQDKIKITQDFKHDLRWFSRFLEAYNSVSI